MLYFDIINDEDFDYFAKGEKHWVTFHLRQLKDWVFYLDITYREQA
jgi:hypothetical protein